MGPDMFWNLCVLKDHKIVNNWTYFEAREKIRKKFGILGKLEKFGACVTKIKNNQILPNKICDIFLVITKLFNGWHITIGTILFLRLNVNTRMNAITSLHKA